MAVAGGGVSSSIVASKSRRLRMRVSRDLGVSSRAAQFVAIPDLLRNCPPRFAERTEAAISSGVERASVRPRALDEFDKCLDASCAVLAGNVAVTSGFFMAAKTEPCRSWLAASRRSIVTSLKPRAGVLAMRSRLMSSCGLMKRLEVSEEIPDLAPVKEALAADEVIAHPGLAQGGFQGTGLGVGAEQDRLVAPGDAVGQARVFNLFDDGRAPPPHRRRRRAGVIFGPCALLGPELFCRAGGRCV